MEESKVQREILIYFPETIRKLFSTLDNDRLDKLSEIRIVHGSPLIVIFENQRFYLGSCGLSKSTNNLYTITVDDIKAIVELVTKSSIYIYEKYITKGFITLPGGHRVGLAGNCIVNDDKLCGVKEFNSLVFRISHEIVGASEIFFDDIFCRGQVKNTVIISPPGCGKTTVLRDLARSFNDYNKVKKIIICALIDERYELAAVYNGKSTMDIGANNFTISGCKKSVAIPIVVRSMSPDIIIADEMCTYDDFEAAFFAKQSGCKIIASVHGLNETVNELVNSGHKNIFDKSVVLSNRNGPGTVEKILEGSCI